MLFVINIMLTLYLSLKGLALLTIHSLLCRFDNGILGGVIAHSGFEARFFGHVSGLHAWDSASKEEDSSDTGQLGTT